MEKNLRYESGPRLRGKWLKQLDGPDVRPVPRPPYALRGKNADARFAQLIAPSQDRLYRLALRITCNIEDAKDVQQRTMLKAYRNIGQFEGRSHFTTWISRIAINEALMCLRKRRSPAYVSLDQARLPSGAIQAGADFQSAVEGPERAYARKELRHLLTHAIGNLRPTYRAIFLLRCIERLSTKETAKVLHISEAIVKARLGRARAELRAYLQSALPRHMGSRTAG
jgi:RNA polymerase sigma-70 factor (ECF subfamily)